MRQHRWSRAPPWPAGQECERVPAPGRRPGCLVEERSLARAPFGPVGCAQSRRAMRGAQRRVGGPRRHRSLHPAAGQLRRPADHAELARPASALRRAHAAARQRHERRHRPALPARELHADRTPRARSRPVGPALRIIYDEYGVPHVYGKTRADLAFGAGWVTARDRGLLIQLGRGPARVAVADVPGINAFGLVTSGQSFVPSAETEALVTAAGAAAVEDATAPRGARSSPTPRPTPTASTPTGRPTTSTSRPPPSTTSSR